MNSYRTNLRRKYPDCWKWIELARRIPGQLTENEVSLLFHLARMRTSAIAPVIVELGAWRGRTSLPLAAGLCGKARPRMFLVELGGEAAGELDRQTLHSILRRCRLAHIVETVPGHSCEAVANWKDSVDILFINATQDHDKLQSELSLWLPFVKLGGIVVLHGQPLEWLSPLQSPPYGDFRNEESLVWAVKQCATAPANLARGIEGDGEDGLRYLLNRSLDAMLHLNPHPTVPKENLRGRAQSGDPSEEATEIAIARLQDYVRRASNQVAEDRHAVQALQRSWSWRLAAPLRAGVEMLEAITGVIASFRRGSPKARVAGLVQWALFGRQIRASGLLDELYYRNKYRQAGWARTSPLLHFLVCGAGEGNNPNELFDVEYYLGRYPDVADSGANPLIHYLRNGAYEGRDPHPHFDSSFYLEQNPDVRESRLNPLAHYLAPGIAEGRDPNPWFDTSEYIEQNPDVATFGLNPLVHQIESRSNQRSCSR